MHATWLDHDRTRNRQYCMHRFHLVLFSVYRLTLQIKGKENLKTDHHQSLQIENIRRQVLD